MLLLLHLYNRANFLGPESFLVNENKVKKGYSYLLLKKA